MIKTISIKDKNYNGQSIGHVRIANLLSQVKSKHISIVDSDSDGIFALHGNMFEFHTHIHSDKKIFLFPTEMYDPTLMKLHLDFSPIAKIIVSSEYFQKYLIKTIGISPNKIKLIPLPSAEILAATSLVPNSIIRLITVPVLMSAKQDVTNIIEAFRYLKARYLDLHLDIIIIKDNPEYDRDYINGLGAFIDDSGLKGTVSIRVTQNSFDYPRNFTPATIVLLPHDESKQLYSTPLIDAIASHKAIVASQQPYAQDLRKKDAGINLYQDEDLQSLIDSCSIILDNKDIKFILEEQNRELSVNFQPTKVIQQYLNLFRRYKDNETV